MSKIKLGKRIAAIVVYGHLVLFAYGLIINVVSPYSGEDTFQMILMGSPLLALVATSAFRWMAKLPQTDPMDHADESWATMSTITTAGFLVALFVVYTGALFNTSITASTLKILVGAIETVLGAYLGITRDTLFPEPERAVTQ